MYEPNFHIAEALAADLAGANVDPNEAAKALSYLRSQGNGPALFSYLNAIEKHGRVVLRSNRTEGYYRDLQRACNHHLKDIQHNYEEMLLTFGWSLRLLRYYRAVPEAAKKRTVYDERSQQSSAPSQQQQQQQRDSKPPRAQPDPVVAPTPPQKVAAVLPAVGSIFTRKVLQVDDSAVVLEVPEFQPSEALGVIDKTQHECPNYSVGNSARVEVVGVTEGKGKRSIVQLKPAPKKKKK